MPKGKEKYYERIKSDSEKLSKLKANSKKYRDKYSNNQT